MINRKSVLQEIDLILETHCKSCTLMPGWDNVRDEAVKKHCLGDCHVGKRLRGLGEKLNEWVRHKRSAKGKPSKSPEEIVVPPILPKKPKKFSMRRCDLSRMLKSGRSLNEIARIKGLNPNTVRAWAKVWGLESKYMINQKFKPPLTRELYLQERMNGMLRKQVQEKYQLSRSAFYLRLAKWGLKDAAAEAAEIKKLREVSGK